jgi:hypothetical protein
VERRCLHTAPEQHLYSAAEPYNGTKTHCGVQLVLCALKLSVAAIRDEFLK